jgi:hydrogenase-4 component E
MEREFGVPEIASALAAIGIKAVLIPSMMTKALRDVQIKREVEPFISLLASIILGACVTSLAFLFFTQARFSLDGRAAMIIPASISTVIVGFILLVTRYKALSQVLGYLVLENGIYIFSLLLLDAIPMVIELGMLLDLFVSVFVVSIITNHINQAFASLDTRKLSELKE